MRLFVDSNYFSPYAMSAFVCLRTKGIDFELTAIELGAHQNLSNEYFQNSLTSRVPTLTNGEFSLSESSAIAEYLEDIQPEPNLFPKNIQDRAKARQIQAWLRSDLMGLRNDRPTDVIFNKPKSTELTPAGKAAAEKLIMVGKVLLGDGRPNLFETWSIADTDLALMLNRLLFNGDPVPDFLKKYTEKQWQIPSVQEWAKLKRPALG